MNPIPSPPFRRYLPHLMMALAGAALLATTAQSAQGPANVPPPRFDFRVDIDGLPPGFFSSVSGLKTEVEVIEYREGGSDVIRKLPGRAKYSNIVLKQNVPASAMLHAWFLQTLEGAPPRRTGSIVVLSPAGAEVLRYNFAEAFPCSWEGPKFDSTRSDVHMLETIELCVERIDRIGP